MAYVFQNQLHGKGTVSIPAGASGEDVQELTLAGINTSDSIEAFDHIQGINLLLEDILGFTPGTDYQYSDEERSVNQNVVNK